MIRAIRIWKTKKDAPKIQSSTFTVRLQNNHYCSSVATYLNTTVFWGTIKMFQTSPTLFPGSGIKEAQVPSAAPSFASFVSHLCICVCINARVALLTGCHTCAIPSLFKSPRRITPSGRPRSVSFISSQWSQLLFPQWLLGHLSQGTWNMRRNLSISEQHFIRFSFPFAAPSLDN